MIDKKLVLGMAIGGAALLLVPGVARGLLRAARPGLKAAAKGGFVAMHNLRLAGAEAFETFEDIAAEVKAETKAAGGAAAEAGEAAGGERG